MPYDDIARFVVAKLPKPKDGWVLSMDRTNWKYGKTHPDLLVVAIVPDKVAIPVVWKAPTRATKCGNSKGEHRIDLMERLLRTIPADEIKALTMDREFIGTKWLRWLEDQGVGYVVRIKGNTRVGGLPAWRRPPKIPRRKDIWGLALFYSGCSIRGKNTRDDYLFLASKRFHGKEARALCRRR